jgi:hypothetical protein
MLCKQIRPFNLFVTIYEITTLAVRASGCRTEMNTFAEDEKIQRKTICYAGISGSRTSFEYAF